MSEQPPEQGGSFIGVRSGDFVVKQSDEFMKFFLGLGLDPELEERGIYRFSEARFKRNLLVYYMFGLAGELEAGGLDQRRTSFGKVTSSTGINVVEAVTSYRTRGNRNFVSGRITAMRVDGTDLLETMFVDDKTEDASPDTLNLSEQDVEHLTNMIGRIYEAITPATAEQENPEL